MSDETHQIPMAGDQLSQVLPSQSQQFGAYIHILFCSESCVYILLCEHTLIHTL